MWKEKPADSDESEEESKEEQEAAEDTAEKSPEGDKEKVKFSRKDLKKLKIDLIM